MGSIPDGVIGIFNDILVYIYIYIYIYWGTAVAQLLRCCTTNRKVAGSIPAGKMDEISFMLLYAQPEDGF